MRRRGGGAAGLQRSQRRHRVMEEGGGVCMEVLGSVWAGWTCCGAGILVEFICIYSEACNELVS